MKHLGRAEYSSIYAQSYCCRAMNHGDCLVMSSKPSDSRLQRPNGWIWHLHFALLCADTEYSAWLWWQWVESSSSQYRHFSTVRCVVGGAKVWLSLLPQQLAQAADSVHNSVGGAAIRSPCPAGVQLGVWKRLLCRCWRGLCDWSITRRWRLAADDRRRSWQFCLTAASSYRQVCLPAWWVIGNCLCQHSCWRHYVSRVFVHPCVCPS